jgi:hypothetical protein
MSIRARKMPFSQAAFTILLFFTSCHDCTITVLQEPELFDCPEINLNVGDICDDSNPDTMNDVVGDDCVCRGVIAVDCPELGLNIGAPCDDGDANTTNDRVDANCICTGEPVTTCEGALLVMRAEVNDNALGDLFLDAAPQRPLDQLTFSNLEAIDGSPIQAGAAFPFQFSAASVDRELYYYGFQYGSQNVFNPLLLASSRGQINHNYILSDIPFAAPVYLNGELYAINVEFDEPTVNYDIQRVDLSDGQPVTLFSGSVTANSQVVNPVFFSATDGTDRVFFVAGTSLFVYSVGGNSVTHVILEPNSDPDRPVVYTGLEYRAATNQLLALRNQALGRDEVQTSLVSISLDGTFAQNELAEVEGYVLFSDGGILHSTAYSECEDTYYITAPVELETDDFDSYLIGVDLPGLTVADRRFDGFLFGAEVLEE